MARPRSEEARKKVFDAAHRQIIESGVLDFTIDAVSRGSGVAKTTIYRHWKSTVDLLHDTVASLIQPFADPDTGSLRGDLIALNRAVVPVFNQPVMHRMVVGLLAKSVEEEALNSLKNRLLRERMKPLRACVERAIERGELPTDIDVDMTMDLLEGPFIVRRLLHGDPIDIDAVETIIDLQLNGLLRSS